MAKQREEPSAYQRALGLLVRREHSRKELGRKLKAKGVEREEADTALDKLNKQDFQNDARFAETLARSRVSAGYGPIRIRAELSTHGLSRDDTDAAMEVISTDWSEIARGLIERRYGNKDLSDQAQRRKAVDFLLRRGFDQRVAFAAVVLKSHDEDH
jgi:regulatory protein